MSLEYITNKGAQLVKRCDTRDPFKIAKELGIKVMFVDEFEKLSVSGYQAKPLDFH